MGEFDPMNVLAQPPIKALQAQGCQVRVHMMQGVGHDFPGDIIARDRGYTAGTQRTTPETVMKDEDYKIDA